MRARVITAVGALFLLALGIGATATGASQIKVRTTGERAIAHVREGATTGTYKSKSISCTGSWVAGGKLVGGSGHVVVGKVEGADSGDAGRTLEVRLSSDGRHAYTPSLATPILYVVFGLVFAALGVFVLARVVIRRPAASASGLPTAG